MTRNPLVLSVGELTLSIPLACVGVRGSVESAGEAWSVCLSDGTGTGVFLLETECFDAAFFEHLGSSGEWKRVFQHGPQLALEGAERYQVMLTFYPAGTPYPGVPLPGGGWALDDGHPSLWVHVVDRKLAPSEATLRAALHSS